MSDKAVVDKMDKPVVVFHRMEPVVELFSDAKKVSEEWFEFLKKMKGWKCLDVVCCTDQQIAWLEDWENRASVDRFNEEHLAYADFLTRMQSCSRKFPTRYMYRKLA